MKKLLLHSVFLFIFSVRLSAQWTVTSVGTTQDLYSVDYYSSTDIWIGSYNQIVKTSTSGSSWSTVPVVDNIGLSILPANMYDIALTSSTNAIGTGFYLLGNTEYILNTTNSGTNWNYASTNTTVGIPRYINSVDVSGTRAVAVGNNGRIARSTDSGVSWTFVSSGTTNLINDVKFISFDTVIAAGNNCILKSINGGTTWALTTITGGFKTVSCAHNTIYISDADGNTLLKSTDYGVSYSTINLPFSCPGVIYAINKDTVLAAGTDGIYVSRSGGTYWEKYVLASYQPVKMFDFLNLNTGMAVGDAGYTVKTSALSTSPRIPLSLFSITGGLTTYCLGSGINFTNTSVPGCTYKWQMDGTTFNTSYTPSALTPSTEGTKNISLIVTNSYGSDTTNVTINVIGHSMTPLLFTSSADSVCSGNEVAFTVPNSQPGVTYQLRKGYLNIGSTLIGTGGDLNFPSAVITDSISFNIIAIQTTSCFTDSLVRNKTIYLSHTGVAPIAAGCTPGVYSPTFRSISNVVFGSITNYSPVSMRNYSDYSACQNTAVTRRHTYPISITTRGDSYGQRVLVWIDYNNDGLFSSTEMVFGGTANPVISGTITIDSAAVANQYLRLRVVCGSSDGGETECFGDETEDYSVTILPELIAPISSFTKSITTLAGCASSVAFHNTSYNAISYTWNFGEGITSTDTTPSHVYSVAGTFTISLIACNAYGCDTTTQSLTVAIPASPIAAACTPTTGSDPGSAYFMFDTTLIVSSLDSYGYTDLTCFKQVHVRALSNYTYSGYFGGDLSAWGIDYNNDGIFSATEMSGYVGSSSAYFISTTIKDRGIYDTPLRMRLITNSINSFPSCDYLSPIKMAIDVTVFIAPPPPVTASFSVNDSTVCSGTNVEFIDHSVNASHLVWDFGDGTTGSWELSGYGYGDSNINHIYATPATYTVKLKAYNGLSSDSVTFSNVITIRQALAPPVITAVDSVLSTASVAPFYRWYKDGLPILGATGTSYTMTTSGNYMLVVANTNGCEASSETYPYFPPHPDFSSYSIDPPFLTEPYIQCGSLIITLYSTSTNTTATSRYSVDWGDGAVVPLITTTGGVNHTYSTPGTYSVKLKMCNGTICDSIIKTDYVTIKPALPAPVVIRTGTVLSTSSVAASYQWYRYTMAIPAATSSSYTLTSDGEYSLIVTNTNGCTSKSLVYIYLSSLPDFYCSPTSGCDTTLVHFYNNSAPYTNFTIYWGDGTSTTYTTGIPSHSYSPGTYTVKLIACNSTGTVCDSLVKMGYITIGSPLALPTLSITGWGLTTATGAASYKWYFNGFLTAELPSFFSNANIYPYTPLLQGDYTVKISNAGGCTATSAIYSYTDIPVKAVFHADTTGYCGVTSASASFINASVNASTYLWDFGDGITSTEISPSHTYSSVGFYTVRLKACGIYGCDSTVTYINIDSVPFNSELTPVSKIICNGTMTFLTENNYSLYPVTYQWEHDGITVPYATYNVLVANTAGGYDVTATNIYGCVAKSNTATVTIDSNCVWPGDADDNFEVNNFDLLQIGLFYGQTGTPRETIDNSWNSFPSAPWGTLETGGADIKHVDCNGDGVINDNDTLAINLNSLSVHTMRIPHITNRSLPDFYFQTSAATYLPGDWVDVDILNGTSALPSENLYGIAFNIHYDASLVEPGTESLTYPDSWFAAPGINGLKMSKIDPLSNTVFGAETRTDHSNSSGFGKIATFRFKTSSSISVVSELALSFSAYTANNSGGDSLFFNALPYMIPISNGIAELTNLGSFLIYPNPYSGQTTISYSLKEKSDVNIEVYTSLGQKVQTIVNNNQPAGDFKYSFSAKERGFNAGVYFVKITVNGKTTMQKIVEM